MPPATLAKQPPGPLSRLLFAVPAAAAIGLVLTFAIGLGRDPRVLPSA
jgi:hypothetical protein